MTGDCSASTLAKLILGCSVCCSGTGEGFRGGGGGFVGACLERVRKELLEKLLESGVVTGERYDTDLDRPGRVGRRVDDAREYGGEMSGVVLPREGRLRVSWFTKSRASTGISSRLISSKSSKQWTDAVSSSSAMEVKMSLALFLTSLSE